MHVPHNTGRLYKIQVYDKTDQQTHVWEGQATNVVDAFHQARQSVNSTLVWTLFSCLLVEVKDH